MPVHLGRRQPEEPLPEISGFYYRLLDCLDNPVFHEGQWRLLEPRPVGDDVQGCQDHLVYQWTLDEQMRLIAVNYSDQATQCSIPMPDLEPGVHTWLLDDLMNDVQYQRSGADLRESGLFVDLPAFGYHLFEISRL